MTSTNLSSSLPPKLDPPGAGLPLIERILLKWYIGPFVSTKATWPVSKAAFEKIHAKIDSKISALSDEQLQKKILVPHIRGIEDSSRYWSIAMVLEHLVIVGSNIELIITNLTHGRPHDVKVDIAAIKPLGEKSPKQAVEEFRNFYKGCTERIEKNVGDWNSSTTLYHPWFGPFRANQWAWLLGGHGAIHLTQVREILSRL